VDTVRDLVHMWAGSYRVAGCATGGFPEMGARRRLNEAHIGPPTSSRPPNRTRATRSFGSGAFALVAALCSLLLANVGTALATTSPSYPQTVFSDGFESGSVNAWDGPSGTGLVTVTAAAAHRGSYGAQITNTSSQYGLITKTLPSPLVDSSAGFWARVTPGGGIQTLAEARDATNSHTVWSIVYDPNQQGLYFYPYDGSGNSTAIFTGAHTAPPGTWFHVEVRYTATSSGGAQLMMNGHTQSSWGVSGDFSRSDDLQLIQLWNDAIDTTDFDDVRVGVPATTTMPPAPASIALPAISGIDQQGQTLTASTGTWSSNPTSYAYQWQDCDSSGCSSISGATGSSYALQASDVGESIDVIVTATNAGGSTPATSTQTAVVSAAAPSAPVNTVAPSIGGTPQQGSTLTASNGSWSNSPSSYGYQWQDCSSSACSSISGATGSSYVLQASDVGGSIDVVVTATNAGGNGSATSARTQTVTASGGTSLSPLHVVGNRLDSASGQVVVLHGTDVSGSSYACEQNGGYGFSDTPTGSGLYSAMVGNANGALAMKWTINSVTLGLNQDCWLGINGVSAKWSGQNYINYVKSEVASMESYHIYPVLTFFVGEPGTDTPNWFSTGNGNAPMPDNDHVPLFWEEVANTFKNDPNVIFRLYEEPWPESTGTDLATWKCWSQGDVQYLPSGDSTPPTAPKASSSTENCNPLNQDAQGTAYSAVGMQSLVNIIRGTGATNIIQVPGVAFANMFACTNTGSPTQCGFLDSADGVKVNDTLNPAQLMGDTDNYPDVGQYCGSITCFDATYAPVAAVMPIDSGEIGVIGNPSTFPIVQQFVNAYDSLGQSYYGSQWESWANLITNYNGTPASGWGTWYYDHITGQ
jgi:endoglucanase